MYYADNGNFGLETGNTAVGYTALRGSTNAAGNTGRFNTALGSEPLLVNSAGNNNRPHWKCSAHFDHG